MADAAPPVDPRRVLVTEAPNEWVTVRASDGRRVRLPADLLAILGLD